LPNRKGNALTHQDLIALAATLTMFVGVFLLPSTWLGLVLIALGALPMSFLLFRALLRNQ